MKKAIIDKAKTRERIKQALTGHPIMESIDPKKFAANMKNESYLKQLAKAFNVEIAYQPDPDIILIKNFNLPQPIPVDISDQTCQAFGNKGFKHGDKIINKDRIDKDRSDDYPEIVMGVGYGASPGNEKQEVLWFKSTHPITRGQCFYVTAERIKKYQKVS